jgi:predicted nucleic acid-binding Zn ribbon protein
MSAPATVDHRPMRNCYKCGREIGPDESICAVCNRAGMATPSASQYHGTIVVAIVAGVALLAVAASLAMRGVGPFRADEVQFQLSTQGSVLATARVTNQGTKSGRAKCTLTAKDATGGTLGSSTSTVSREVSAGGSVLVSGQIPGVGTQPATVTVSCQ